MSFGYKVTEPSVLQSAAGYYIGTRYWDDEMAGWYPFNRLSFGYYATVEDAEKDLPFWLTLTD